MCIDIDFVFKTKVACSAAAAFSDNAKTVRVVYHDSRAVFFGKVNNFGKSGNISAHTENTVGNNETAGCLGDSFKAVLKVFHVAVAVAEHLAEAEAAPVVYTGVILSVADNVVRSADDGTYNSEVRLKTR